MEGNGARRALKVLALSVILTLPSACDKPPRRSTKPAETDTQPTPISPARAPSRPWSREGAVPDLDSGSTYVTSRRGAPLPRRTHYSEDRAPCAEYNAHRNPHFGDLHVHTARSLDAGIQDTRTTPYQAYLFAKGERIGLQPWTSLPGTTPPSSLDHMQPRSPANELPPGDLVPIRTLQLGRPLDYAMVSDHAEFFGEIRICGEPGLYEDDGYLFGWGSKGHASKKCVELRKDPLGQFVSWNFDYLGSLPGIRIGNTSPLSRYGEICGEGGEECLSAARATWQEAIEAAEVSYDKSEQCEFTAFVGYEYTSTPISNNMHRNVVFRNANVPKLPISYLEARRPELLWSMLLEDCKTEWDCEVLAIPHNSNVSGNRMFRRKVIRVNQRDFDPPYATARQQFEPLIEIYQHKGDSECRIDNTDELCAFEKFPFDNLIADRFGGFLTNKPDKSNFVRYALGRGLELEERLGVNPFRYGLIGGTDTHLGTPGAVNEVNFPGHGGAGASKNDLVATSEDDEIEMGELAASMPPGLTDSIAFSGGGLSVIWSEENSRDYLFEAMQRRETYGTSGPRMVVRFFGGWDYAQDMCADVAYEPTSAALKRGPFVEDGYANGVPMGSDLPPREGSEDAPVFVVAAFKDPGFSVEDPTDDRYEPSTPLQQIQIVKGWLDEKGKAQERVVSVVGDAQSKAGVDLNTCEPTGPGADQLCSVWRDDDFDAGQRAFYYARVVENPTCRWSWRQCLAYGHNQGHNQGHDQSQDHEFSWETACSNQSSLPEGFRNCCLHEDQGGGLGTRYKRTMIGTYPRTIQERAWTSPIWYQPREL
ncbi:MAG: DUF3604 domain-containing protein [Deltaproteobacteria bacterium]|nr:DUF3604 domain-containing protein [Deltaproteobacteria bacterium]MBW2697966.1 DUF3604 domain-containing protein [Deltaproteobacteria bacterium]